MESPGSGGFIADLQKTFGLWRSTPSLFMTAILIGGVSETVYGLEYRAGRLRQACINAGGSARSCPASLIGLPNLVIGIFALGFVGTVRVWYVRAMRQEGMSAREVWGMSWRFLGHFVLLAVTIGGAPGLVFVVLIATHHLSAARWFGVAIALVTDVLLTFIVPSLALTTNKVSEAIRTGVSMLKRTWPADAPYALAPPLVIVLVGSYRISTINPVWVMLPFTLFVIPAIHLLFRGATTLYFVREVGQAIDSNGAAYKDKPSSPARPLSPKELYEGPPTPPPLPGNR